MRAVCFTDTFDQQTYQQNASELVLLTIEIYKHEDLPEGPL